MSAGGREVSPPMDADLEDSAVRKGRGWTATSSPDTVLRADAVPVLNNRRARSPQWNPPLPDQQVYGGDDGDGARKKHDHKMSRAEALLQSKAAVLAEWQRPVLAQPSAARATSDWACAVCSNWNSSEREACFRCSTTYADSAQTVPTNELFVGPTRGCSVEAVKQALLSQLDAAGLSLGPDELVLVATPTGAYCYAKLADVATASKAMALLCCSLNLGHGAAPCSVRFSQERYVRGDGTDHNLPPLLRAATWSPPEKFPSASVEKSYLGVMSKHWDALTAAQKAFYDERVRLALQSPSKASADSGSATAADDTETSHATSQPSAVVPSAPSAPAEPAAASSSAVSSLKQRLALRKAAKTAGSAPASSGGTSPDGTTPTSLSSPASQAHGATAAALFASAPEEQEEVVKFFAGMPIPPCFCGNGGVQLPTRLAWTGIPLSIAEHLLPPHLLERGQH